MTQRCSFLILRNRSLDTPNSAFNFDYVYLFFGCFSLVLVSGLRCYQCLSSSSMADCSKTSTKLTCPEVTNSCAKISTEVMSDYFSFKSFSYGCATKKMCDDAKEELKMCEKMKQEGYKAECSITCCQGDLCSPLVSLGITSVPSLLLLLPCVIFTLIKIF